MVSPLTQRTAEGRHAASVSIRSGRGSMTHDRVMRFVPVFDTPGEAASFATEQAMAWIDAPTRAGGDQGGHPSLSPGARWLLDRTGTRRGIFTTASSED